MPSRDNTSAQSVTVWRPDAFEQLCNRAATAVGAVLTRVTQRFATIKVGPVSEEWLCQHREQARKQAEGD